MGFRTVINIATLNPTARPRTPPERTNGGPALSSLSTKNRGVNTPTVINKQVTKVPVSTPHRHHTTGVHATIHHVQCLMTSVDLDWAYSHASVDAMLRLVRYP